MYHITKTSCNSEDGIFFVVFALYMSRAAWEINEVVFSSSCLQP